MSFNAPVVRNELKNATPVLKERTGVFTLSPSLAQLETRSSAIAVPDKAIVEFIRAAFPLRGSMREQTAPQIADWDKVVLAAEENAVAPLLYASIKKLGRESELPANCLERLRISYFRSDTANQLALDELKSLIAELNKATIPVVVLKGGALATTLYPEPGLRPMSDLDLLIRRSDYARVEALLAERDYTSPVELGEGYGPDLTNYRAYGRVAKHPAHIEIHWHLFKSPYYCQRVPIDWFWNHTTEITLGNQKAIVLTHEAQLVHLAAHFALHHRAERLLWSYDLALMLTREGVPIDWDLALDAAEQFGLVPALSLAIARVTETWGVDIPPGASARLGASRVDWRDRTAFAIMTAPRGNARFFLDAVSQPRFSLKAKFITQHIFPARAYMRERYRIHDERRVPLYYGWRLVEGPWRMLRSIISTITRHS